MRSLMLLGGRFVVTGLLATLVHYLCIVLLVDVASAMSPTAATVIGAMAGIATAYLGNYHFVFRVTDRRHGQYATRFAAVYASVMAIHAGVMFLFTERLGIAYEYGFVVATVLSATTTFLANRYLVFADGDRT